MIRGTPSFWHVKTKDSYFFGGGSSERGGRYVIECYRNQDRTVSTRYIYGTRKQQVVSAVNAMAIGVRVLSSKA